MSGKLNLKKVNHKVDFCVVGGGLAGIAAAISAARHGAKVALMQDRPVLGGNASSEIRMWVSGAGSRVRHLQETGIIEEILLENMYRNPNRNFSIWDSILYEKVRFEPNIILLLNCACCDAEMDGNNVKSITGFQLTTYTWHTVEADIYADCSGDSILAGLTGAEYMVGREDKSKFGESMALEKADRKTMGMSLMIQAHETDKKVNYMPPKWAYVFNTDEEMNNKPHECLEKINTNFYWIELGGEQDSIHDTEEIRDELLKIAFGVWDHIKNRGDHGADNWELDWIGFLPGKRESRRYVGDYVMTQDDVIGARIFDDTVAYGAWQIDNHLPGGFKMSGSGEGHLQKVRLREPYGIPYRSLYSKNIDNLMFAGRNISASHLAFASTRVMATCAVIGQAVGTSAALAVDKKIMPRAVGENYIAELQDILLEDDCFLPKFKRKMPALTKGAVLTAEYGDPSNLQNGVDRKIWGNDNGYCGICKRAITYLFDKKTHVNGFRIIADSDLDREFTDGNPDVLNISTTLFKRKYYNNTSFGFPRCMLKSYDVDIMDDDGNWKTVYSEDNNIQRLIKGKIDAETTAVRLVPKSTHFSETLWNDYGSSQVHIFAFDLN
ncbi:MAG: FAD-dependent oxidoreductase [Oscillospiraceae bacterium]|nr:FAD-dependent oxidoreductase [Oscillospiraceae bacterium]